MQRARQSVLRELARRGLEWSLCGVVFFFFSSRRRHTRFDCDWSSDVCSSDLVLGDVVVAAIYQSGRFQHADAMYVWGILAGASVGLVASTFGRLYASTYYALRDTQTPLRYEIGRASCRERV